MKPRNGIWQSDFYLSNGTRVRESLGTRDKALAQRKERELQVSREAQLLGMVGTIAAPSGSPMKAPVTAASARAVAQVGITLEAAFKRGMREYEPWRASTSKTTITANYGHVSSYFKPHRDLASLTRDDMLEYVEQLRDEEGLSGSTINQRLSLVSVLMNLSEAWTKGVVQPFKMPRQKVRKGRIRVLSYDEEFKVIRYLKKSKRARGKDHDFAELVKFLVDTGFRLGEALRLRSVDVDWDNGMVPAWETKGDEPRQVPMTKRVREILEHREALDRPFGMFSIDSADDHWEIMRKGLKVDVERDPEFVIHALRHTCASRLVASGMDAFRVQKWMGHKNITTTQKYVTLFGSDLHDLANALDARRLEAAKKVPIGGPPGVAKIVPRSVPKRVPVEVIKVPEGIAESLVLQGIPIGETEEDSVGEGLLIRRSLVRAQVGEPAESSGNSPIIADWAIFLPAETLPAASTS